MKEIMKLGEDELKEVKKKKKMVVRRAEEKKKITNRRERRGVNEMKEKLDVEEGVKKK